MQKLFLFLLIIFAIYYIRRLLGGKAERPPAPAKAPEPAQVETVRECRLCGLHVPQSEGEIVDGEFYCSTEHARQATRRGDAA